jgi:hypothetical protein
MLVNRHLLTTMKINIDPRMSAFLKVREEIKHRVANQIHLLLTAGPYGLFKSDMVYERVYVQLSMNVWNPVARVMRQIDSSRYESIQQ